MMKHFLITLTRRKFLVWIFSSTISTIGLSQSNFKISTDFDAITLRNIITNLVSAAFKDPTKTTQLGFAYIHTFPQEADASKLVHALLENNIEIARKTVDNDINCLNSILLKQIKNDFKLNKIVNIDGWIVSQTEARLSALTNFI